MKKAILLGFLVLLALDTAAQVSMKLAADRIAGGPADVAWLTRVVAEPLIYLIATFYTASFLTYVTLLKHAPVGPAYAAAHGHIVTTSLVSVFAFGDRLTTLQLAGGAAIVAGVVILALTETPEPLPAPGDDDRRE